MDVFLLQTDIVWEDPEANFARIDHLTRQTRIPRQSLLVLPELCSTGFSLAVERTAEIATGRTTNYLRDLARRTQSYVVGGLVRKNAAGNAQNVAVLIDPSGEELTSYAKMHPFSLPGEDLVHLEGSQVEVCELEHFSVAPVICYDLRFPELFRAAVDCGADLFVVVANWPAARVDHWSTLLKARAIENQAYVVGVNRCGADPNFTYPGKSAVFDPQGKLLIEADANQGIFHAVLDPQLPVDWRRTFPALRDRRNDLLPPPPSQITKSKRLLS
jgi:predicted amidohydrolase